MNRGRILYLARKRLGIFLAFTSSFPFSQCNSQQPCGSAAFPGPLCVSLLFCLRSCGFPARHQLPVAGKKPLGKAARPPGRLLAEIIPAGCASFQLAGSCVLPGAFGGSAKIQMLQSHWAGNFPQELTTLLLFYPARQACSGCLN